MLSLVGLLSLLACGGDAASPSLAATPEDVAFGDVSLGGSASRTITLTNTTGSPLTITDVSSTGSALVTSGQALPLTLSPGESTSLAVELVPSAAGEEAGVVTVTSDDGVAPALVKHLGKGVHPTSLVVAAPAAIAFGAVGVGDRAAQQVTLTNGSTRDVVVTSLVVSGSGVSADVPALPFTLRGGESASLSVAFAPTVAGEVAGQVAVRSDQPHPVAIVSLTGRGATSAAPVSVVASPPALDFGDVTVGEFSARTLTITNLSAEPVELSRIQAEGAGFGVSGLSLPTTLSPGASVAVTARFSPAAAGAASGSLTVSGAGAEPLAVVTCAATGVPFSAITSVAVRDASVLTGGSVQLTADVAAVGTIDKSLVWSLAAGAAGSIDATSGVYTAPQAPGAYRVTATSRVDPTKSGSATVTVTAPAPVSVAVSPATAALAAGARTTFSATVSGSTNTGVTWSVQEGAAGGSITSAGVYTAPATAGTYHVVATSSADRSKTAVATVTVSAPAVIAPSGPQLYVATWGNDANPGTEAQPWRTIQKAMNSATPGSTVNIRGGTYNERLTMNVQGTSSAWITFQPYGFGGAPGCGGYTGVACGGEQVILDYGFLGTNLSTTPLFLISGKSYVRVQGLTFQNFTCNGPMQQMVRIDGASAHVEFQYNRIRNSRTLGPWDGSTALMPLRIWGPARDIVVRGNEWSNLVNSYGEACTVGFGASRVTIEKNYIHDIDAIGIDIQYGSYDYVVRDNRLAWISKRADGSWWYNNPAVAIYNDGAHTGVIERNYVTDAGVGYQALAETNYTAHDVTFRNNIATRCVHGIVLGTWYSNTDGSSVYNIEAYNNTFYGNTNGIVIRPMVSSTVSWKNNIFANNGTNYVNTLGWNPGNADYNLYYGNGLGPDPRKLVADPQFNDPAAGDFSIRATSPAVNGGDPGLTEGDLGSVDLAGNPRLLGGRVDVGAFEAR